MTQVSEAKTVRERPILFSGPMVRAILDGRKRMTRRVAKLNAAGRVALVGKKWMNWHVDDPQASLACPYGLTGDQLWVRETFFDHGSMGGGETICDERIEYRANEWDRQDSTIAGGWTPSIHMPRWASRITLEITDVRLERLQDITESDVLAEGIEWGPYATDHRTAFAQVWNAIEPIEYCWPRNPWVWVMAFKPVETK